MRFKLDAAALLVVLEPWTDDDADRYVLFLHIQAELRRRDAQALVDLSDLIWPTDANKKIWLYEVEAGIEEARDSMIGLGRRFVCKVKEAIDKAMKVVGTTPDAPDSRPTAPDESTDASSPPRVPAETESTPVAEAYPGDSARQHPDATKRRHRRGREGIEKARILARQMLAEGASHLEVCQRLGSMPRPPNAAWRHLPWDKAYFEPQCKAAVSKWISANCRA
jgi:hypothetical protein